MDYLKDITDNKCYSCDLNDVLEKFENKEFVNVKKGKYDLLLTPTSPTTAFKIGEKMSDPVSMYLEDLFTVPANISGMPALVVPYAKGKTNLPLGMQFMADDCKEGNLFDIAKIFNKTLEVK